MPAPLARYFTKKNVMNIIIAGVYHHLNVKMALPVHISMHACIFVEWIGGRVLKTRYAVAQSSVSEHHFGEQLSQYLTKDLAVSRTDYWRAIALLRSSYSWMAKIAGESPL